MQAKLIEITLRPDEEMHKHPAEVLAELRQVVDLNGGSELGVLGEVVVDVHRGAGASEPGWEVGCVAD
jgi:hypothetical protein